MKEKLLTLICCPNCHRSFKLSDAVSEGNEIAAGVLSCGQCSSRYPIRNGLPIILDEVREMRSTKRSFGKQWAWQGSFLFERDTIYGMDEVEELADFEDALSIDLKHPAEKVILDAGCGNGRLTKGIGQKAPKSTVVGMDISDSARVAFNHCLEVENVHIVQCDIRKPPFRPQTFDYVWSEGVIHHTPNSSETFEALDRLVASDGRFYVWVYPSYKFSPYRLARDIIRKPYRLPLPLILIISWLLALPVFLLTLVMNRRRGEYGRRSLRAIAFGFFDNLSPEYQHRHSKNEVTDWFASQGYSDIRIRGDLGVFGKKNNETSSDSHRAGQPTSH